MSDGAPPAVGMENWAANPDGVIRPIALTSAVYQTFPSGPKVISPPPANPERGMSVICPAGVIRLRNSLRFAAPVGPLMIGTYTPFVNQRLPSGPNASPLMRNPLI